MNINETYNLNEREKKALELKKEGMNYKELGKELGVSPNRARVIYMSGREKERHLVRVERAKRRYKKEGDTFSVFLDDTERKNHWIDKRDYQCYLNTNTQAIRVLLHNGITTIEQIDNTTDEEFLRMPAMGKRILANLRASVEEFKS